MGESTVGIFFAHTSALVFGPCMSLTIGADFGDVTNARGSRIEISQQKVPRIVASTVGSN